MNKGRRNELAQLKRKKRLRYFVNSLDTYITKDGRRIHKPKVTDLPKNDLHVFKSTGTPCSCAMCSPGKIEEKAKYRFVDMENHV